MSLVELMIAIVILGTATAMTMEFLLGARNYSALAEAQDELATDLDTISTVLSQDLAISGWAVSATASFAGGYSLPSSAATDRSSSRYFPYVLAYDATTVDSAISSGGFAHARISPTRLPDQAAIAASLTGTAAFTVPTTWNAYRAAALAPSHALIAVALQQGAWSDPPRRNAAMTLRFGTGAASDATQWRTPNQHAALGILQASPYVETYSATVPTGVFTRLTGLSSPAYGEAQDSMVLSESSGQFTLLPQWETLSAPTYDGSDGMPSGGSTHFTGWREYMYVVLRPPVTSAGRFGRLVRARKVRVVSTLVQGVGEGQLFTDPTQAYGFVVDRVLSDNVIRVVFETMRSAPAFVAPPIDQVRVTLWLLRPVLNSSDASARVPRRASFLITMRTEARSTIKGQTTLPVDSVILSAPHPSYPVTP